MPAHPSPQPKSTSIVLGIFCALVAIFVFEAIESHASFHIDLSGLGDDRVRLNIRDDDVRLRLDRKGTVTVTADGRIEQADPGDRLEIEDRERKRMITIVGRDGDPEITYRRGRTELAFDADARAWLAETMLVAYRRGGLDADRRAAELLDQGIDALVDEVRHIDNDHVAVAYLQRGFDGEPTAADLARMLDVAARKIGGDHSQMTLLREVPPNRLVDPVVREAFVRAVSTIGGDHSMRWALEPVLEATEDRDLQAALLAVATKALGGDHEASQLLITWADSGRAQTPLPDAAYALLDSIGGDHSMRRAAGALVEALPTSEIPTLVDRLDGLRGEHDQSQFLIHVAEHHLDGSASAEQEAVRASIRRALTRIGGDHSREMVERALDRS